LNPSPLEEIEEIEETLAPLSIVLCSSRSRSSGKPFYVWLAFRGGGGCLSSSMHVMDLPEDCWGDTNKTESKSNSNTLIMYVVFV
jgi:hypothetical protein